jgi:hypothetical protein
MKDKPFITLENVTLRVRDRRILENTSWEMKKDQHWAVLGPNGAGKSVLVKSLFGEVPVVAGKMTCYFPGDQGKPSFPGAEFVGYVAPELARGIIARENLKDEFRHFSGRIHRATNVADVITANHLSKCGKQVAVVEIADDVLNNMGAVLKRNMLSQVGVQGIQIYVSTKIIETSPGHVKISNVVGETEIPADHLVIAAGYQARVSDHWKDMAASIPSITIGDAFRPGCVKSGPPKTPSRRCPDCASRPNTTGGTPGIQRTTTFFLCFRVLSKAKAQKREYEHARNPKEFKEV